MNCPPDVADILLEIMSHGILSARFLGWQGDANRAAIEANHIHNLPDLLKNYSLDRLNYYWDVERTSYVKEVGIGPSGFDPWWEQLAVCIERLNKARET